MNPPEEKQNDFATGSATSVEETERPAVTEPAHLRLVIALEPILMVLSIVLDMVKVILLGVPLLFREIFTMLVPRPQKDVRGQVVLITGAGNGLGRAMAQLFAARGSRLVLVDIDLEAVERVADELRVEYGVQTRAYRVDVSLYEECRQLSEKIDRDGAGPVDLLINNAGLIMFGFVNDSPVDRANAVIDVNLKSHIWMTKVFLDGMMKRKYGHIVGISSMSGMYAFPWGVVYSATKFAVSGFMASLTEQLRIQGLSKSIRTTCVNPYYVTTRKDVIDFLQKPRFAPLTVDQAARQIVKGILREDIVVTVPRLFGVFTRFMLFFPVPVQQVVRDYLMREYELNNNLHT